MFEENTRQPQNNNFCLFRALAPDLHGYHKLEEEISDIPNLFNSGLDGFSPNQFQGVHMNDNAIIDDLLRLKMLLCDIHFVDGTFIGELVRRRVQKYGNTVRFLRCKKPSLLCDEHYCCLYSVSFSHM